MACAVCSPANVTCNTVFPTLSPCRCDDTPAIREEGPAGGAATITIGSVTTLSAGDPATVVNVGTSSAAIFNFGIPEGPVGPMPDFDVPIHMTSTLTVDDLLTASGGITTTDIDASGDIGVGGTLDVTGLFTPSSGIVAVANNSSASAGIVGEFIQDVIAQGSAIPMTSNTALNIASISLTAGDWDIEGVAGALVTGTTSVAYIQGGSSLTSAVLTLDTDTFINRYGMGTAIGSPAAYISTIPSVRVSINATTTVYLVMAAGFTTSTCAGYGAIRARRVR